MDRPPIIMRSEVTWVVFILAGIAFVVGVAVMIGSALTALPFIMGDGRRVRLGRARRRADRAILVAAATIGAFMWPTALDSGQRSPRRLLAGLVQKLVASLRGR